MKTKFNTLTAILLIFAGILTSCDKINEIFGLSENGNTNNEKEMICNFKDPLTDLPWLKEYINTGRRLPGMYTISGMYINIFQCTYNDGIVGFLIDPCVNCFLPNIMLYSCEGVLLASAQWGDFEELFEEWNVKNKELIWTNIK